MITIGDEIMKKTKGNGNEKGNIFIAIVLAIMPIIYFAYSTYMTLVILTAKLHTDLGYEVEEIMKMHDVVYDSLRYNGLLIAIYALFLFLLFLEVALYRQSKKTILIILNVVILIAAIVAYYYLKMIFIPLIFIVLAVVSLVLSFSLKD